MRTSIAVRKTNDDLQSTLQGCSINSTAVSISLYSRLPFQAGQTLVNDLCGSSCSRYRAVTVSGAQIRATQEISRVVTSNTIYERTQTQIEPIACIGQCQCVQALFDLHKDNRSFCLIRSNLHLHVPYAYITGSPKHVHIL